MTQQTMTKEQILEIPGYEGLYSVSDTGVVYSLPKKWSSGKGCLREIKTTRILSASTDRKGYKIVGLRNSGGQRMFKVHRLVAITFIQNPLNLPCVNHKDGDKTNNFVSNLEWVSVRENNFHSIETKLRVPVFGEKHGMCKLSDNDIEFIRKSQLTTKELSLKYKISVSHVNSLKRFDKRKQSLTE